MCCGNSRRHGGRRVRRNGSDSDAYSVAYSDVVEGRNPFIMRNIRPSGFPAADRAANCRHWGPLSSEISE
ncbi:hypothetical protein FAUST_5649 [Fusarium austroamericanum]|uniref:Uncharacterized protein n=1 Tax=Fusarium austroamericanum TaxID=282268 RepID=A0AAN6C0R2_FUSAU|nr:hypothetical protein FAUST_5649 [Fusarium austroamericanum]